MAQAESTAMAEHARSVRRAADKDERRKKNIHKALRAVDASGSKCLPSCARGYPTASTCSTVATAART